MLTKPTNQHFILIKYHTITIKVSGYVYHSSLAHGNQLTMNNARVGLVEDIEIVWKEETKKKKKKVMENIYIKKIDKQETTFELFLDIWWLF